MIPPIVSILNFFINADRDKTFWVGHCWGHNGDRESEENEATVLYRIAERMCYKREYHVENYVGNTAANIIDPLLQVTCGGVAVFYLVYMSNIVEIVLYIITSRHVDR